MINCIFFSCFYESYRILVQYIHSFKKFGFNKFNKTDTLLILFTITFCDTSLLDTSLQASFNFSRYILTTSIIFFSRFTRKDARANSALDLWEATIICVQRSFAFESSLRTSTTCWNVFSNSLPPSFLPFPRWTGSCHIFYLCFVEQGAWQHHPLQECELVTA